jgi:ribosome-associated translation inhibitor RaiA
MNALISETKDHIKKLIPRSKDVEIKVDRDEKGNFISKIHVRAKKKIFHAAKKDTCLSRSLDKSYHAILHQVHRMKDRMKKARYTRLIRSTYESENL